MWECPRETTEGEQMDFVEMEIENGLIQKNIGSTGDGSVWVF